MREHWHLDLLFSSRERLQIGDYAHKLDSPKCQEDQKTDESKNLIMGNPRVVWKREDTQIPDARNVKSIDIKGLIVLREKWQAK